MQNIEIKARFRDFPRAVRLVESHGGTQAGTLEQRDVYYEAASGRLKLRHLGPTEGNLIQYQRADTAATRLSSFELYRTNAPEILETVLSAGLPVIGIVIKQRQLYMIGNVRVHLDTVDGLGRFIEFEAVLDAALEPEEEREKVEGYLRELGIVPADMIAVSYLDLMREATPGERA